MTRGLAAVLLLTLAAPAAAQLPVGPASRVTFEIDPGRMQSGTTTVPRPEANLAFEYKIDGGAPVAAVKASACVPATGALLTCFLRPPTMPEGTHTLEIRAHVTPAEPGIAPGPYSPSLSVAMLLITAPGTPSNTRITVLQP